VSDLTPKLAAAELCCSCTLVYRLIERGELPGTYELPGSRRKRIPRADLEALKQRQRMATRAEVPAYEPALAPTRIRQSDSFADELSAIERGEAA
jgi:excisionase family DNA binding protein